MQFDLSRTIVALSTAAVPARRAIVRLSGSHTKEILRQLTGSRSDRDSIDFLESTHAISAQTHCRVGWGERTVPARFYFWPNERSYTGEPCAEIHLIGSLPIVERIMEQCIALGASPAERGEFTLRSFLAGKIDLPQAEAILGVIEADRTDELALALEQLAGNISTPVRNLRRQLIELSARLEAGLDFVEEDIEFITEEELADELTQIQSTLISISEQLTTRGKRVNVPRVLLLGFPNAGKSSLFNALVGAERAIVSNVAGTTRDTISKTIELNGIALELSDSAGLEELHDTSPRALAQTAVNRALERTDAVILCVDLSVDRDHHWLKLKKKRIERMGCPLLVVGTKSDLRGREEPGIAQTDIDVSLKDSSSIRQLADKIPLLLLANQRDLHSNAMHHTMVRCKAGIDLAVAAIGRALDHNRDQIGEELVAAELRFSIDDLGSVIGEVHSEDILGEIFSRFCIGK